MRPDDPLRRSLAGALTVVLATLTLAAGGYFAWQATRGPVDPRPAMTDVLDALAMPDASLLHERASGAAECGDTGCPTVERWWTTPVPADEACPAVRTAVSDWGGIRFQRLGTAQCGYLGVMGPDRLTFSVAPAIRARLPRGVAAPDAVTVIHVGLTRD